MMIDEIQEELIALQHDTNLKDIFELRINLEKFWSQTSRHSYLLPQSIFNKIPM